MSYGVKQVRHKLALLVKLLLNCVCKCDANIWPLFLLFFVSVRVFYCVTVAYI